MIDIFYFYICLKCLYIPLNVPLNVYHIVTDTISRNPCSPSPCGPNSVCRVINQQPVCSCVAGYLGAPPACRPECTVSSDCSLSEACSNQKCVNPCPGSCGFSTICNVVNHNPICSCLPGFTGDPFVRCILQRKNFISLVFNKIFLQAKI